MTSSVDDLVGQARDSFAAAADVAALENAKAKLVKKGCDILLANDVAGENVFGADENHVYLVTRTTTQEWPRSGKDEIARKLVQTLTGYLKHEPAKQAAE